LIFSDFRHHKYICLPDALRLSGFHLQEFGLAKAATSGKILAIQR
jgi:hypothetical protein